MFYKGGFFGTSTESYGVGTLKFTGLNDASVVRDQIKITNDSSLEFEISIRRSGKELKNQNVVNIITVVNEYPEFNINEGVEDAKHKFIP